MSLVAILAVTTAVVAGLRLVRRKTRLQEVIVK